MKKLIRYAAILSCLILTACPGVQYESAQSKLYKNNMDLPKPERRYYQGIHFDISELLENSYNTDYVIKDNALVLINYDLNLNCSVEMFTESDAEHYKFMFSDKVDNLNAVHDYYVMKRQNSLENHFTSIKKPEYKKGGFRCLYQSIEGSTYSDDNLLYLMSSVEVGDKIYVFQMIGKKENMGYLNDDFRDIINSIEK